MSSKLVGALSRLYQRRLLRPNKHFFQFFEIYKIRKMDFRNSEIFAGFEFAKTFNENV
jgi:hypothetical protein